MSDLKKAILARIAREQAHPLPRWLFVLRHGLWWLLLVTVLLVAGLGAGVLAELLDTADWEILPQFPGGTLHFFWVTAGLSWLVLMAAGLGAAVWIFRQTPQGYRTASVMVLALAFLGSVGLGGALTATPVAENAVELHTRHVRPLFENILPPAAGGVLEGVLSKKSRPPQFVLRDFAGTVWQVDGSTLPPPPTAGWPKAGQRVRFLGQADFKAHTFRATLFRPLKMSHHFGARQMPNTATQKSERK